MNNIVQYSNLLPGLAMQGRELKQACCNIRDPLEKKREVFLKKFLPKHPPILNEWFRKTFPDAQVNQVWVF